MKTNLVIAQYVGEDQENDLKYGQKILIEDTDLKIAENQELVKSLEQETFKQQSIINKSDIMLLSPHEAKKWIQHTIFKKTREYRRLRPIITNNK